MPINLSSEEKRLVRRLLREHERGRSWRKIAVDYPGIKPGTLSSIAAGDYFPEDSQIRRALGLKSDVCRTCHRRIVKRQSVKPEEEFMRWWRNRLDSKGRRGRILSLWLVEGKP